MDYEQLYKDALAHAREIHRNEEEKRRDMEWLFPELKESDERIRKVLIDYFKEQEECAIKTFFGISIDNILAWLKKQGKQKPFDYENANIQQKDFAPKVEPKFKVGDWIVNNDSGISQHIKEIVNVNDETLYVFDGDKILDVNFQEQYHLWTIQDAKDGDVLVNGNEIVVFKKSTFNEKDLSGSMFVHCSLRYKKGSWCVIGGINPSNYVPAAKEQRDLLFSKMKESGYEWDAEKKELKKSQRMVSAEAKEALYGKPALLDFENTLADICRGWIGEEPGWEQYIKDNADVLLRIVFKKWNDEMQGEQNHADKVEPIVVKDFNSVFSREHVEEIDKRIEESQRLYNAKLRDAMQKEKDFPMTD